VFAVSVCVVLCNSRKKDVVIVLILAQI
jgi:hypothetical protein